MPPVLADITQGHRLARFQGEGFALHEVSYPTAREMPAHAHRTANITLVLAGSLEEQVDHCAHLCRPLSVIFKPSGAVHATRCAPHSRSLVLELSPDLEDSARRAFALLDRCQFVHHAGPVVTCLLALWRRAHERAPLHLDAWFPHLARAARASAAPGVPGRHVRRALAILDATTTPPSTAALALTLGLHPVYLARLCRRRTGSSPTQLRVHRQVGHAVDRLVRTADPLSQVALHAGFSDQAHLCRRVKRATGLTPGALRRLASREA
jgi:AraC family transcriptional regulator